MCVILRLLPGQTVPYNKFQNATFNNPHGYGILLKDKNKIQLIKENPENGNDPEKIFKTLEDASDIERWLHLRYATKGSISFDNTQPFSILSSKKRDMYFMHNGTIGSYNSNNNQNRAHWGPHYNNIINEKKEDDESDSKQFSAELTEILTRLIGDIDLNDPVVKKILDKFWSFSNGRAVIVPSDQDPFFFSKDGWKNITWDVNEKPVIASNDDYFDRLKRGPVYEEKLKKEAAERASQKKEEEKGEVNPHQKASDLVILTSPGFSKRFSLKEDDLKDVIASYDLYHPGGYMSLANLELNEIELLLEQNKTQVSWLFMTLTGFLREEVEKRVAAEKAIERTLSSARDEASRDVQKSA